MTPYEIAKEFFPDASDDLIEYIVWEKTGFPSFWDIPTDGNTPERRKADRRK